MYKNIIIYLFWKEIIEKEGGKWWTGKSKY